MIVITNKLDCKTAVENLIADQFDTLECAICINEISNNNKGVVYVTCGGIADLERTMCQMCDKRFEKQDPYKRNIEYRFEYPFVNDAHAAVFLEKSKNFVLNDGNEEKVKNFTHAIHNTRTGVQDIELNLRLRI
ncbi:Clas117 [Clostera anastomosis granulovirus B]|uniref:Clas117 n=1 Tax=Clostera anastomosis granulovirus B TaxID=1986290 RepID=A0A0K0WSB7_9BBAC|nr:Clas117 [Clostera anastomosis granulovirus B]AKS25460.1 Clas117 [Clostera anastomosis granulovirus B]